MKLNANQFVFPLKSLSSSTTDKHLNRRCTASVYEKDRPSIKLLLDRFQHKELLVSIAFCCGIQAQVFYSRVYKINEKN